MYMLLWGKFVLYKYVTCWLVTVSRKDEIGSSFSKPWSMVGRRIARRLTEWLLPLGRSVHFDRAGLQ